jgi:hypothetical protein
MLAIHGAGGVGRIATRRGRERTDVPVGIPRRQVVTVRVACEGDHTGTFFELLSPTHRRVWFDVVHRLALESALLREDRIVLDVRRIISQLVAPTPPPPSPSPTMPTYSRQLGLRCSKFATFGLVDP